MERVWKFPYFFNPSLTFCNVVSICLHIMDKTIIAATRYTLVLSIRYMFLMQLTKPLKTLAPELPMELSHRSSSSKL